MSTVAKILSKIGPQFNKLEADTAVIKALAIMKSENVSYIIVMQNGNYAGLFTEKDYTQKIAMGKVAEATSIGEVMTSNLPHIGLDGSILRCMMLMTSYKTRYLPVFEEFEFQGIITMKDLVKDICESVDLSKEEQSEVAF